MDSFATCQSFPSTRSGTAPIRFSPAPGSSKIPPLAMRGSCQPESQKGATNLLDVVVGQGAAVLELLAGENQSLLVGGDALLVLDLGLDIVDGVARLDVEGNGLTRQGLDEAI